MSDIVKDFLSPEGERSVIEAIGRAEKNTSGEIRVHIEAGDGLLPPLVRASRVFETLGMHATQQGNAVLLYIDVAHHGFAVWGGRGIDAVVSEGFWDETYMLVRTYFREGKMAEGLVKAIEQIGVQLKEYFPYQSDDVNELPDEISRGNV